MKKQLKSLWTICVLICITLITLSNCKTQGDPQELKRHPPQLGLLILEPYDTSLIPYSVLKIIQVNEYKFYLQDIRWRIRDLNILMIDGIIYQEVFDEKMRVYNNVLDSFEQSIQTYLDSID